MHTTGGSLALGEQADAGARTSERASAFSARFAQSVAESQNMLSRTKTRLWSSDSETPGRSVSGLGARATLTRASAPRPCDPAAIANTRSV